MKRRLLWPLLLAALLLCACGQTAAEPEETAPPIVELGGTELAPDIARLDLAALDCDWEDLLAAGTQLPEVREIELGKMTPTGKELAALQSAYPQAQLRYRAVSVLGSEVAADAQTLALPDIDPTRTEELIAALPWLGALREIDFTDGEGGCAYAVEDVPELDKLREAAPDVKLDLCFTLFGQTLTSEDTRIEYQQVPIGNEGVEQFRAVLPYLSACEYLLLDGCDIDNEVMAQFREDYPDVKIVWRIWLIEPNYNSKKWMRNAGVLSDATRIRTLQIDNDNCHLLRYCTETKYVDFGHNYNISDFSFLGYMPKLEVCIIALTSANDLSPLANCPNLEYLECYGTQVTDLSPLAACTNLKHLNCSRLLELEDISCLYDLDLDRLRCVVTHVPKEQLEEYARLHPDCEMLLSGYMPHLDGWRYDYAGRMVPRYELLREQLEYDLDHEYGIP